MCPRHRTGSMWRCVLMDWSWRKLLPLRYGISDNEHVYAHPIERGGGLYLTLQSPRTCRPRRCQEYIRGSNVSSIRDGIDNLSLSLGTYGDLAICGESSAIGDSKLIAANLDREESSLVSVSAFS